MESSKITDLLIDIQTELTRLKLNDEKSFNETVKLLEKNGITVKDETKYNNIYYVNKLEIYGAIHLLNKLAKQKLSAVKLNNIIFTLLDEEIESDKPE